MEIVHREFVFQIESPEETFNPFEVSIRLTCPQETQDEILWDCTLKGLWTDDSERETPELSRVWSMHDAGDYFQHTLIRHNKTTHPRISYTSLFHEMVKANRERLPFINNIYSTSRSNWLSMGYSISIEAQKFWDRQVAAGLATYISNETRFRALI